MSRTTFSFSTGAVILLLLTIGTPLSAQELPGECRSYETPLGLDLGKISRVLRADDWRQRSRAVRCLSYADDGLALLQSAASDSDPRVRRTILFALGEKQIYTPLYISFLSDTDSLVRSVASRYAYLAGAQAAEPLLGIAADSAAPIEQRVLALQSLERLADPRSTFGPRIVTIASKDGSESVRIAALRVVCELGTAAREGLGLLERRKKSLTARSLEHAWLQEAIVRIDPSRLAS